jgi:hypothetical protein
MKNLFIVVVFLCSFGAKAEQNSVVLMFNHLLNGKQFISGETTNSFDGKTVFSYTMLRYYISNIKITHDGGKITEAKGVYLLVNVASTAIITGENDKFDIGKYDISSVEAIEFAIGIDSATNHLDPSSYPWNSPLAPQNPTMHWGWNAGYRFVTLEGLTGATSSTATIVFQIHSLGDELYTIVKKNVNSWKSDDGSVVITLNAEYKNLIKDIDVSAGMVEHGTIGIPTTMMSNFGSSVFSAAPVGCIEELSSPVEMTMYPNPTQERLVISMKECQEAEVIITNVLGEEVLRSPMNGGKVSLSLDLTSGMYGVGIIQSGKMIARNIISIVR